jgi:uncharacterized protein DUF1801
MPELKTRPTTASVTGFIERQPDEQTRADCLTLVALMEQVTGEQAVMWGPSIIGFGTYRLVYANGSEADWPIAGFSPRKKDLTIYLTGVFERRPELMKKLGKHSTGKVCLNIRRLADVDMKVLKELVVDSVRHLRENYRADTPGPAPKKDPRHA